MKCAQCGSAEVEKIKLDHPYEECGLPNVTLIGIPAIRCRECGTVRVRIPAIEGLHRALALSVLRKRSRLSGPEVRFLRKYIGLSGSDFAKRIGSDRATVSRWENDKQPLGPQTDRLLRLLVVTMGQVQGYPVEALDQVEQEPSESGTFRIEQRNSEWLPAA